MSVQICRHYVNTYSTCGAGVDVAGLVDAGGRVPCMVIRGVTGLLACASIAIDADKTPDAGEMVRRLTLFTAGQCPTCERTMTGTAEVPNGAVVALPCRHVLRSKGGAAPREPEPNYQEPHEADPEPQYQHSMFDDEENER